MNQKMVAVECNKNEIALGEFNRVCQEAWEQRKKVDEMARLQKEQSNILETMKSKVLAFMEQAKLEKTHIPGYGTLYTKEDWNVRVPQGDDKAAFFAYLDSIGVREELTTVNSQTLNSWFKDKLSEAVEAGNVDFKIPGIGEPTLRRTLGFRSA